MNTYISHFKKFFQITGVLQYNLFRREKTLQNKTNTTSNVIYSLIFKNVSILHSTKHYSIISKLPSGVKYIYTLQGCYTYLEE